MSFTKYVGSLFIILAVSLFGCNSGDSGSDPVDTDPNYRLIAELHDDPGLSPESNIWNSISSTIIPIGTQNAYNSNLLYTNDKSVEMKALISDSSLLYIWAKWDDASMNNRFGELHGTWTNNQVTWLISYPSDTSDLGDNEDRFYILFGDVTENTADCAIYCHSENDTTSSGHRFYKNSGINNDAWAWKANRTGLAGRAEDMHLTDSMILVDPQNPGITNDLYRPNYIWLDSDPHSVAIPKYMHHTGTSFNGPGLLESDLLPGEIWTPFDPGLDWILFSQGLPDYSIPLPSYYIWDVTGIYGSRWDVETASSHDGTHWTLVFRRPLITNDLENDMGFNFSQLDSLSISCAITNNSGISYYGTVPFYLIISP